jgi:hypothetical protein
MNLFKNEFPDSFENESYVYGCFIKDNYNFPKIAFIKKDNELRPIGGTLRLQNRQWFNASLYIQELIILLQSLRNNSGEDFYTDEQQLNIIKNEKMRDEERGEYAPYFRIVVYNWLRKTGLYILHMEYIGNIKGKGKSLTKHLFYIRECMTYIKNADIYLSSYTSDRYQFDRNFAREDNVQMMTLLSIKKNMYKGKYFAYLRLLQELIMFYYQKKTAVEQEKIKKHIEFLQNTHL